MIERTTRTREDIKRALKTLLGTKRLTEITIAEVSREAGVSRSTYYAHYRNLGDVYEELVLDFQVDVQTLPEHFDCETCRGATEIVPFCEKIRHAGSYAGVVEDPRFFPTWLALIEGDVRQEYLARLERAGLTRQQALAVFRFHMSGCLAVAQASRESDESWKEIQRVLDEFIDGGLSRLGASAKTSSNG